MGATDRQHNKELLREAFKNYLADFVSCLMFFAINKVENGPKRPYNRPKRAKMYEKRQK